MNCRIEPDVVWSLSPVGDPQLSRDGRQVVWVQEEPDRKKNRMVSRLWIADADGENRRPLTGPGHRDRAPRWSPVDDRIVFLSDRGGRTELWVIDAGGGEAEVITIAGEPAAPAAWSPDGRLLAVSCIVQPVTPDCLEYPGSPVPGGPDERPRAERPVVVVDPFFKLDGVGLFGSGSAQIGLVEPVPVHRGETASVRWLTTGRFMHMAPAWSPDGSKIAFAANRAGDGVAFDARLYVVDISSGEITLALEGERPVDRPTWSPDGRWLAFLATERLDWGTSGFEVFVLDVSQGLPSGQADIRSLTSSLDRLAGGTVPSDTRHATPDRTLPIMWDHTSVYFTVMSEGTAHIYRADPSGEGPIALTSGQRAVGNFSVRDGRLAYVACSADCPDEIYVLDEGKETRISAANDIGASWIRPERLNIEGADGWKIDAWLLSPPGVTRPPLVLSIHGGPSGMYGNAFQTLFQILCANGYAVLYCNPRGSQGYGREFAAAVRHDWGGKDYIDLMSAVDTVISRGLADPDRMGVTGWSYGGFMTNWVVGHTDRFRAAVAGACVADMIGMYGSSDIGWQFVGFSTGGYPWAQGREELSRRSPVTYADRVTTPVLYLHGEADTRCPISQSELMFITLRQRSVPTALVRYPEEPHGLGRPFNRHDRYRRMLSWFDHHLRS